MFLLEELSRWVLREKMTISNEEEERKKKNRKKLIMMRNPIFDFFLTFE